MSFSNVQVIILAAGKGTRMRSEIPKVLHPLNGAPMIHHILKIVDKISPAGVNIIVGHKKEEVIHSICKWRKAAGSRTPIHFIAQEQQLGTGHAVLCAEKFIDKNSDVLVLLGDAPLIQEESLIKTQDVLSMNNAAVIVLTTEMDEPHGYGRIIRDSMGQLNLIREQKEANTSELKIKEINTGIFLFHGKILWRYIHKLQSNNQSKELYITDIILLIKEGGYNVVGLKVRDYQQFLGINSPQQLLEAEKNGKERQNTLPIM